MTSRWNSGMFFNFYTFGFYCNNRNSIISRARGTDLVRLRPASASVRFLRNLPVRRPNPSLKRTNEVRPPSASVRLGKMFERPRSESVLEADEEGASVVRLRP